MEPLLETIKNMISNEDNEIISLSIEKQYQANSSPLYKLSVIIKE